MMSKKISGAGSCLFLDKGGQGTKKPKMKEVSAKESELGTKEQGEKELVKAFRRFIEKE